MAVIGITSSTVTEGTTHALDSAYSRWLEVEEGGVMYLTTPTIDPSDTDAEVVSPGIAGSLVNGQKLIVGFNTTLAGANVTSDFHIDGSKPWMLQGHTAIAADNAALAVDLGNVAYRPLVGNGNSRDTFIETNVQDNGVDGRQDQIITEAGLEISVPETHAILKFS